MGWQFNQFCGLAVSFFGLAIYKIFSPQNLQFDQIVSFKILMYVTEAKI